jgi:hypothetical protein
LSRIFKIATNQAVNFTVYQELKKLALSMQETEELSSWQHLLLGGGMCFIQSTIYLEVILHKF